MKKPSNLKLKDTVTSKRNKAVPAKFEVRKQQYEELKALRQDLKERKEKKMQNIKKERKRLAEKKKQKEINDLKSGKFQVVKNPEKVKKWKVKARRLLQKVPPEIFYENTKNK